MKPLLILRPEPGASVTAEKAQALGMVPLVAPLFTVRAEAWDVPDRADFDALLLTSANALRHGGAGLAHLLSLPVFAVGEATAEAARLAGFALVTAATGDANDALALAASHSARRLLHLSGHVYRNATHPALTIERISVYLAEDAPLLPALPKALASPCVALVHSPRAARRFAEIAGTARGQIAIVAISPAALAAAGTGWVAAVAASQPDDGEMLALAARLCQQAL